jgi:hypothetical protein
MHLLCQLSQIFTSIGCMLYCPAPYRAQAGR